MSMLAALAIAAGLCSTVNADPPPPQIPAGDDIFGQPNQGPGAYPGTLSAANVYVGLPANTVQGRFGSNALKCTNIFSGPMKWTAGNMNEGDLDLVIGPAQPADPRSFPMWPGWDAYRQTDGAFPSDPLPAALPLPASQWPDNENWGRYQITGGLNFALPNWSWGTHPTHGVFIASPACNGRDNLTFDRYNRTDPMGTIYAHVHVSDDGGDSTGRGYNPVTGQFRGTGMYMSMFIVGERPQNQDEAVVDVAAAYFPYEEGWLGGFYDDTSFDTPAWRVRDGRPCASSNLSPTVVQPLDFFDARHRIALPNASPATGMLFAQACTDDNDFNNLMGVLPEEGGWQLAQRPDYDRNTAGTTYSAAGTATRFVFVYVPWDGANLIGAQVSPNGVVVRSAGTVSVAHAGPGNYEVLIPGKTNRDGALIVTSAGSLPGNGLVPDRAFYSSQYDANRGIFVVQSRELTDGNNTWGEAYPQRDAGFYFIFVDFVTPPSPFPGNPCTPCISDYNQDGGVTGDDVAAFFIDFEAGAGCSDVNQDGGITGSDIETFFLFFENSGC